MDAVLRNKVEDEIERLDIVIKAAESWGRGFKRHRATHAQIIKIEARMQRNIRKLFREKAAIIEDFIDWNAYNGQLNAAFNVQTIVSGDFFDGLDSDFLAVTFNEYALAIATGAQAGESIYKIPLGIRSTDAIIQQLTTERLASLIGKRVSKDGKIVDNPTKSYRISDKVRSDIAKSIQTSINLGEDKQTSIGRLTKIINNPARAEKIAQTETVNAYNAGTLTFARESGAVGKIVDTVDTKDECANFADEGIVPIDHLYGGSDDGPAFHVGCRCTLRIVYKNEMDQQND